MSRKPNLSQYRYAIIGTGRMGGAILAALRKEVPVSAIVVTDPARERCRILKRKFGVRAVSDNRTAVKQADVVCLCVKPQVLPSVLSELAPILLSKQLVVSVAAGVRLAVLEAAFPHHPVVRVMPNQPALVAKGVTGIAYGKRVLPRHRTLAKQLFGVLGVVCEVPEAKLDAVTAVGGSGPGFLYYFAKALVEGGVRAGLSEVEADRFVREVFWGVGHVLKHDHRELRALCGEVTSPQGTTWAGLTVWDKKKLPRLIQEGILAATRRAQILGQQIKFNRKEATKRR